MNYYNNLPDYSGSANPGNPGTPSPAPAPAPAPVPGAVPGSTPAPAPAGANPEGTEPDLVDPFSEPTTKDGEGNPTNPADPNVNPQTNAGEPEANPDEVLEKAILERNYIVAEDLANSLQSALMSQDYAEVSKLVTDGLNKAIFEALTVARSYSEESADKVQQQLDKRVETEATNRENSQKLNQEITARFPNFTDGQKQLARETYQKFRTTHRMAHDTALQNTVTYMTKITGTNPMASADNRPTTPLGIGTTSSLLDAFKHQKR